LPAKLLFEEIMKMSEDRDKSSIKFLLLMEGYFLLQTKVKKFWKKKKIKPNYLLL